MKRNPKASEACKKKDSKNGKIKKSLKTEYGINSWKKTRSITFN